MNFLVIETFQFISFTSKETYDFVVLILRFDKSREGSRRRWNPLNELTGYGL